MKGLRLRVARPKGVCARTLEWRFCATAQLQRQIAAYFGASVMDLNQVTLPSTDVARSAAFYRALGFTQIVSSLPCYARFECPIGGATFSLHQMASVPESSGVVVYFECVDLDATCQQLKDRGVIFDTPPTDQPWLWREAYLRDPDGNVICLYRAGDARRNPPWRLSHRGSDGAIQQWLQRTSAL